MSSQHTSTTPITSAVNLFHSLLYTFSPLCHNLFIHGTYLTTSSHCLILPLHLFILYILTLTLFTLTLTLFTITHLILPGDVTGAGGTGDATPVAKSIEYTNVGMVLDGLESDVNALKDIPGMLLSPFPFLLFFSYDSNTMFSNSCCRLIAMNTSSFSFLLLSI